MKFLAHIAHVYHFQAVSLAHVGNIKKDRTLFSWKWGRYYEKGQTLAKRIWNSRKGRYRVNRT